MIVLDLHKKRKNYDELLQCRTKSSILCRGILIYLLLGGRNIAYSMKRVLFSCAILFLIAVRSAVGQFLIDIPRPGEREFVQDLAGLISDEHKEEIRSSADKILTETANPIIVVTIEKMTNHNGDREMRIETFAHFLFDKWEIGIAKLDGVDPEKLNRGILLLVSKGDRKARI